MFRKILAVIFLLMTAVWCFSGCAVSKEDVRLLDKKGAEDFAEGYTKTWKYLGCDDSEEFVKVYNFTDTELGFDFIVRSSAVSEGMDGAAFYYKCSNYTDWDKKYAEMVIAGCSDEVEKLCAEYSIDCDMAMLADSKFIGLKQREDSDPAQLTELYDNICAAVSAADPRSRFGEIEISVTPVLGSVWERGSYTAKGGYVSATEWVINRILETAAKQLGKKREELTLVSAEQRTIEQMPYINEADVTYTPPLFDNNNTIYKEVYFSCGGRTYKAVNIEVGHEMYLEEAD